MVDQKKEEPPKTTSTPPKPPKESTKEEKSLTKEEKDLQEAREAVARLPSSKRWTIGDFRPPTQDPDNRESYEQYLKLPDVQTPPDGEGWSARVFVGVDFVNVKTKGGETKAWNGDVIVTAVDPETGEEQNGVVTKLIYEKLGGGSYEQMQKEAVEATKKARALDDAGPTPTVTKLPDTEKKEELLLAK